MASVMIQAGVVTMLVLATSGPLAAHRPSCVAPKSRSKRSRWVNRVV